ncbi:MAG: glycoside hydrolase family 3 C-terminal domain-containing protein [Lachnospiraceae bacterium]|nr:glycoside hydrolase family 3 C-terminal domain-containing protein [Lachnospiraceae bacterium]
MYGLYRADPLSGRTYETGLVGGEAIKVYNMLQHYVLEHSRFGIPMLLSEESPHGHQALDGYLLPVNLAVGAAFDPELVGRAAHMCGRQLKERGVDLALVSMLDVLRDPRWGRSEECFGEDPYLASVLADSVTRGLHAEGVEVVAKHFAAQGETTGGVNASAARIGERELREIHLPPAKAAIKAGASGIMAAYNEIDGIPCHANAWLLQDILRGEMGFDGIVMADGLAVDRLKFLGLDPAACGATALNAGVDVSLWDNGFSRLEEALERGLIPEERLDEAVLRVLTLKFERGLFDRPYLTPGGVRTSETEWHGSLSNSHSQQKSDTSVSAGNPSLDLARESLILLKNTGVLPLVQNTRCQTPGEPDHAVTCTECDERNVTNNVKNGIPGSNCVSDEAAQKTLSLRVALVGDRSRDIYAQLGDYTPPIRPEACQTIEQGLQDVVKDYPEIQLTSYSDAQAVMAAAENDVTILVVGGSSSRFGDVKFDTNGAAIIGQDTSTSAETPVEAGTEGCAFSSEDNSKDTENQLRPDLQPPSAAENIPTAGARQIKPAHITMDCGEGVDVASLALPEDQLTLAREVYASAKGKVITIVLAGRPYVITELAEQTDALLYAFYPGPYGGRAIAELILGEAEPSGRLPASLPRSVGQLPVYYNPRMSYEAMHYCDETDGPLYPFGYGLGYGEAIYSDFQVRGTNSDSDTATDTDSGMDSGAGASIGDQRKNTAAVSSPQTTSNSTTLAGDDMAGELPLPHDDKDLQQSGRGHLSQLPYIGSAGLPIEIRFTATNPTEATVYAVPMLFIRRIGGTSGVIPRREELKGFGKQRLLPGESGQFCFMLTEEKLSIWNQSTRPVPHQGKISQAADSCQNRKPGRRHEDGHLILEIKDGGRLLWESVLSIPAKY